MKKFDNKLENNVKYSSLEVFKQDDRYEKIDKFYQQRFKDLTELRIFPNINKNRFVLFSAYPIQNDNYNINLTNSIKKRELSQLVQPLFYRGFAEKHNLEGYCFYTEEFSNVLKSNSTYSYFQVFRNGIIEFFSSGFHSERNKTLHLAGKAMEELIDQSIDTTLKIFSNLDITPIFYVKYSIIGLQDTFIVNESSPFPRGGLINRDKIDLPSFLVHPENIISIKEQIKDILWQCGGIQESPFKQKQR